MHILHFSASYVILKTKLYKHVRGYHDSAKHAPESPVSPIYREGYPWYTIGSPSPRPIYSIYTPLMLVDPLLFIHVPTRSHTFPRDRIFLGKNKPAVDALKMAIPNFCKLPACRMRRAKIQGRLWLLERTGRYLPYAVPISDAASSVA